MARDTTAQLAVWNEYLWSVGDQGDPYALILRAPDDPYPLYEEVRARGPLHRSALGTWVTADHKLSSKVLRDRRFGVRQLSGEKAIESIEFDNSMLGVDPPDHGRLRKLAIPAINPGQMESWRPRIETYTEELVEKFLAAGGRANFMTAFAQQLPNYVISELLGIPDRHRPAAFRLTRRMARMIESEPTPQLVEDVTGSVAELYLMFEDIIALRRADPGDDLVTQLLPALDEGRLSKAELVALCAFLTLGGVETTVNLIGNATLLMLEHPDQFEMFKGDPGLAPAVIQETLRFETPTQQYRRIVQEDLELAGQVLPADSQVAICAGAANRDPEVYPDPGRFDITRPPGRELLSFSLGIHFCLGAALARLEGEVALAAVARRLPNLRRIGPIRRRKSYVIRGMLQFPVAA
ncbi:MAG TPA: cytochrome P450 [Actinophytocola sp.]|uniref:cytochrome P450 n=1 Tax=Actinophytocola sp. TaxID=1872138 RepID=UPI002DB602B8|nr:cytochrome P450 [Actinophytocola sp.]HEU5470755.1 cytochrome P450 [Actinophytocola sp.]